MDVGKSIGNPSGIASFLRPYLARGEVLAIVECTPEQLPLIEREDPHLVDTFQILHMREPSVEQGKIILQLFAYDLPAGIRQALSAKVLDVIDRLHRRYATYSAYPGRPLRFVQNLLQDAAAGGTAKPVTASTVFAAFSRETGLPRFLLDPSEPLDLKATRDWFAARVIGQPEAVELVTDLIGTVKAGLTRPQQPIASLLFVGPTGIGKTEMAKSLAEYLFGSSQRLTRFDMSEYNDPAAVQRLVGTTFGAEGLLTAKVREQPFSVILLDEFEKAHPQFFDLLLQMLGEGRLTDAAGRLADFRNAVIILTSNLGAESYQQGNIGFRGESDFRTHTLEHFTREAQRFLRPEMFNRIDRIVAFAPLDPATVLQIAHRQLRLLHDRAGIRFRGVNLQVTAAVAEHLATTGYEPRYGARPLKRAMERQLLAPLAEKMNGYATDLALNADVSFQDHAVAVKVKPQMDAQGRPMSVASALPRLAKLAGECLELRRQFQRMERCTDITALRNELYQLERTEASWLRQLARARDKTKTPKCPLSPHELTKLARLREYVGKLETQARRSREIEEESLLALFTASPAGGASEFDLNLIDSERETLVTSRRELLLTLYCQRFPKSDAVTMGFFSEERSLLVELIQAYIAVARGFGQKVAAWVYTSARGLPMRDPAEALLDQIFHGEQKSVWRNDVLYELHRPEPILRRTEVLDIDGYLAEPELDLVGMVLQITGLAAYPRFVPEQGVHLVRHAQVQAKCLVEASDVEPKLYLPPDDIHRKGAIREQPRRRFYDVPQGFVEEGKLRYHWADRKLVRILAERVEGQLLQNMESMLED
jgi:hypothetical protein